MLAPSCGNSPGSPRTPHRVGFPITRSSRARCRTRSTATSWQISRWMIKTAGAGGEKPEMNITEASLQKSEDGKTWTTVDTFTGNRKDIIDRLVPPFGARHVRIVSTKGGAKPGDNGFRVIE